MPTASPVMMHAKRPTAWPNTTAGTARSSKKLSRKCRRPAKIANATRKLKPGMFANLELTLRLKEQAVVIPESSIISSGDRTIVYVVGADDTAQIRPVKLGIRLAGIVEVISGLQGGERVVAEGIQKVRPGGKVRAAAGTTNSAAPAR